MPLSISPFQYNIKGYKKNKDSQKVQWVNTLDDDIGYARDYKYNEANHNQIQHVGKVYTKYHNRFVDVRVVFF